MNWEGEEKEVDNEEPMKIGEETTVMNIFVVCRFQGEALPV